MRTIQFTITNKTYHIMRQAAIRQGETGLNLTGKLSLVSIALLAILDGYSKLDIQYSDEELVAVHPETESELKSAKMRADWDDHRGR